MHTGDEPVSGGRRPHAPSQSTVCGVPLGKPPAGKTGAVNLDSSKYLGATAPSSSGGHPASSSASSRSAEKPLVFRHGECHRSQVLQEGMHRAMPGLPWAPHRIAHADGATLTERHALVGTVEWMSGQVADGSPHKMAEYGSRKTPPKCVNRAIKLHLDVSWRNATPQYLGRKPNHPRLLPSTRTSAALWLGQPEHQLRGH